MQSYNYFDIHSHNDCIYDDVFTIKNVRYGVETIEKTNNYYSLGVHPYDSDLVDCVDIKFNLNDPKLVAIGEIGLDYRKEYYNDNQVKIFESQLKVARSADLPVIIHCVKAVPQTLNILKKSGVDKVVFHGFNNNFSIANSILTSGYAISFGGNLLKNSNLQGILKVIIETHPGQFFFETDDSKFDIRDIYKFTSELTNVSILDIQEKVKHNFEKYFGK